MLKINRRPGTQDISWFLDQHTLGRLDLSPPYQRRSVWTPKDRRYFLDTLFRGFPCPPIYLHKTIDPTGGAVFHIVDGKQRIETIIRFSQGKVRIPENYGDDRLNNKRWKDILADTPLRNQFLNYPFVVEYFDEVDSTVVNEIFERMNKNSRKLTQQELRNARYDGWFSNEVDRELEEPIWRSLGIVTTGRARRMADAQFIAELFMLLIDESIVGFDHGLIDEAYANYEDPDNPDLAFNKESFAERLTKSRSTLQKIYDADNSVSTFLSSVSNLYSLWAVLVLNEERLPTDAELIGRYLKFVSEVDAVAQQKKIERTTPPPNEQAPQTPVDYTTIASPEALEYFDANQSATTEFPQRAKRFSALHRALKIEN
ncbi:MULTISPECIES: DUF262 domain-containing protein [unclassified Mesorhizobium]|uniref:DUF262 domain-containing protein n=1 Tax=unclassified Mesorhizobium TaxID=325217 RepID=UPI0015E3AD0C|nr:MULTISPECIES: DUF262 domain-containing protein [unclassified Mesorhizobium]